MTSWIFLRGLTRESRHWGDFIEQFQRIVPDARVVALDLPGNGHLNQQRSPLCVQDMMEQCRTQLALRGVAAPYHLLAMSLGAMVTVAWCATHPQEVLASVLINTSMRPFSPFYQRLRPANYGTLLKLAVWGGSPELWEQSILRLTSNRAPREILPRWLALRQDRPVSRANAVRQLLAAARFRAPVVAPLVPTLVLTSEQDHLVSVKCSEVLARRWRCALRIHTSAGHDLPLDDGPWVADQVREWLLDASNIRALLSVT